MLSQNIQYFPQYHNAERTWRVRSVVFVAPNKGAISISAKFLLLKYMSLQWFDFLQTLLKAICAGMSFFHRKLEVIFEEHFEYHLRVREMTFTCGHS